MEWIRSFCLVWRQFRDLRLKKELRTMNAPNPLAATAMNGTTSRNAWANLRRMATTLISEHDACYRIWNVGTRRVGGLRFIKIGRFTMSYSIGQTYKPLKGDRDALRDLA